jgi:uncharacterized delta-60 repeat protein
MEVQMKLQIRLCVLLLATYFLTAVLVSAAPGDVDLSFDAGAITTQFAPTFVNAIAVQPDGKILVGGFFDSVNGVARQGLARLNADGSLDTGFVPPFALSAVKAIAVQPDGKILVGGSFDLGIVNGYRMIVRLNANGSLDSSFNVIPSQINQDTVFSIAIEPGGNVLIGGSFFFISNTPVNGLARLSTSGTLIAGLGAIAGLGNSLSGFLLNVKSIALQTDGKIVIGGEFLVSQSVIPNLARLNPNGTIDPGFNNAGTNAPVSAVAVQIDGKILTAGTFTNINGAFRRIARLNTDGSVETAFAPNITGGGGILSMLLQTDGKILIGVFGVISGSTRNGIARLNANGSLDSFYPTPGGVNNAVLAIARQTDGKVLIGGDFTSVAGIARSHLARLLDTPVNSPPDAVYDTATTNEDSPVVVSVLANDTDPDGNPLTITSVTQGTNGSVVNNGDGTVTYTPNANFNGVDSFTYTISDGSGGADTATVSVAAAAVNDPPFANSQSVSTNEDTPKAITLTATEIDGDPLSYSIVVPPTNGTLTLVAPNLTYMPAPNYNGPDSFTFKTNDGSADSNIATVSITVNAVNDPPVAGNNAYTTNEDTTLTVATPGVLGNDIDIDSPTLAAVLATGPMSGTLSLNANGSFTYTPNANFNGGDTFTYRASDGSLTSNLATVNITTNSVNDPPIAIDDAATTERNAFVAVNVLANDTDPEGEALTVLSLTQPANGTASLPTLPNGAVRYSPNSNFTGDDFFTYTLRDASGGTSVATVSVTVRPANRTPVAVNDNYVLIGATLTIAAPGVLSNDTDSDGDPLTARLVTAPLLGSLTLNPDGSFTYSPQANFTGCDSFDYYASDGRTSGISNSATVTITSSPAADPLAIFSLFSNRNETEQDLDDTGDLRSREDNGAIKPLADARDSLTSVPSWSRTASLSSSRVFHSATPLRDGKVLVVGGTSNAVRSLFTGRSFLRSAEIYDPQTGMWSRTGDLSSARGYHTATLLPDGKVLVAGGIGQNGVLLRTAEVYDPETGVWTPTNGNLNIAHAGHTATLVPATASSPDGKVLVVAGVGNNLTPLDSAEIYDPVTGLWTRASNLLAGRWAHTATYLPNGKVLVAGGYGSGGSFFLNTGELYDPKMNTWTRTVGNLNSVRGHHTATLLRSGSKVLFAGGLGPNGILRTTELYDPATRTFTQTTGRLNTGRWLHTATLLRSGKVLVASGNGDSVLGLFATNTAELYDPTIDAWAMTANLTSGRHSHTATILPNNKVLATGGMFGGVTLSTAKLYDPLDSRRLFSTCAGVTVTQFHGEEFHGNSRIARIENGRVACMNSETGELSECLFSTSGASAGLMWVEAIDGQYAKTGQAITQQGAPDGEWIVAARVNSDGSVPCVAPPVQSVVEPMSYPSRDVDSRDIDSKGGPNGGMPNDTIGTVTPGEELISVCPIEDIGQEYNAASGYYSMWMPILNHAMLEVCTSSNPHPDDPELTRTISSCNGTVYCYRWRGAALNDINGTERDVFTNYYTGNTSCHVLQNGGFEVPAAKRPATRSLPAPGSVNVNTPILWRPVNPNVSVAN